MSAMGRIAAQRLGLTLGLTLSTILLVLSPTLQAQTSNAQLSGQITDPTGAVIGGATIKAVNNDTNVPYSAVSNGAGIYVLQELVPGPYSIAVEAKGFGAIKRSGLRLSTGDHLAQNFELKPGAVEESVTVSGGQTLISSDEASTSVVLDNKMITELPQLNRDVLDLTATIPSVQGAGPLADNIPALGNSAYAIANNGNSYSLSGGQVNGTSILVDGNPVQDSEWNASNRSVPTPDGVGEFRVETGALTADKGRYSGGIISIETKSGTSQFHGRLFEYFRNQILNSNDWMNNAQGVPRQAFHQNNYGASFGGPIVIPHFYSGRKHQTFFFFGWEGERFSESQNVESTVPTLLNRAGDFSQTVINQQNGNPVYAQIYDPFNGHTDANNNWVRPQFPGSKIPLTPTSGPNGNLSGQSQVWAKYMSLWPAPNHQPSGNSDHVNNYYSTVHDQFPTDRFMGRFDENISDHQRVNANVSRSNITFSVPAAYSHGGAVTTTDIDWSGNALYTWEASPTSVVEARLGVSTSRLLTLGLSGYGSAPDTSIDTTTWGFDPLLVSNPERVTSQIPPGTNVAGYSQVGGYEYDSFVNQNTNGTVSYTKLVGRHTLKFGYAQYFYRFQEKGGDNTGVQSVGAGGGSNEFWNNNDGLTGSPLAELMMGSSSFFQWGNWNITPFGWNQAAFAMDDWKVNNKLSVQLGLRWDHDGARSLRHPQGSVQYDINAKNVLQADSGYSWSSAASSVPGLSSLPAPAWTGGDGPIGQSVLLDTPQHPQTNLYTTTWRNYQPRIGVSYAYDDKTVFHLSGGIVDQGLGGLSLDYYGMYYNSNEFTQVPSLDGKHWVSELGDDHGLGTFPLQADGTHLGWFPPVTTNTAWSGITFGSAANPSTGGAGILPHYDSPTDYMWGFSVERQLGKNFVLSGEYQGIKGVHLLMATTGWSPTNIPVQYYQLGSALQTQVPNPFYGQSQAFNAEPTVPLYQLLSQSPQYTSVSPGQAAWGKSFSNFGNIQIQTRAMHGLTMLASYALRKTLTNSGGKDAQHASTANRGILQNPHNLMEGYGLALYEKPQTMKVNIAYDLPVGQGRQFLGSPQDLGGKIIDGVIGGWGIAEISVWDPKGTPVLVPDVSGGVTAPGAAIRWSLTQGTVQQNKNYNNNVYVNGVFLHSGQRIFNPSVFSRTPDYTLGTAPFVFPNVRNPGDFSTDATLLKKFYFSKDNTFYLESRIEATNVFNHPTFGQPGQPALDPNPDDATFGGVNGKTGSRIMQIGLRIFF
jgi:hypothetical protein